MEMEATINPGNFKENATIVEQKGIRKFTVVKRKIIHINVRRIGRNRMYKTKSMQAVLNNFWLALITKIAQFLNFVADVDHWQNKADGLTQDGLNKKLYDCKTQDVKAVNDLIVSFEGQRAAGDKCNNSKLKPKIEKLKTQAETETNNKIASYQELKLMQQEFNRQKQENTKCFDARDYMGVQPTMRKICPTSNGLALKMLNEAKTKIKSGPHSRARSVLYDYLTELEVMGLGICPGKAIEVVTELKPTVKFVGNKLRTDTNCKALYGTKILKDAKIKPTNET
mmetsp:Transcript_20170/g.42561  ORF Transcript_20170/g.42561 Transcript_20170/m.42561 type:complete len:283 (+) Transcript_20170:266-1114(+)|eukprot:CAMPEP_0171363162 /NCGR_PEP_ID=MMETSP0879-20121228/3182_1 /TAXON_ID=67004 /ORGANISM="Thalassiosira weissflogii, Strain CCMP1336" /LENGTH=282 /DNA_ID=CAMNT_0011870265 /DNA_START=286 /DNA_END=1134 /DNA_ORIENTATION=+